MVESRYCLAYTAIPPLSKEFANHWNTHVIRHKGLSTVLVVFQMRCIVHLPSMVLTIILMLVYP